MITVNIESITPEKAYEYMLLNSKNRPISQSTVDAYASDMASGAFCLTHQGIAFYEDGSLADGQHRLSAIIKSKATIELIVTRGIEKGLAIDRNRPRSISDCAKLAGHEWIDKSVIGIITAMYSVSGSNKKFTVNECICIAEKHKENLIFVLKSVGKRSKGISHSGVSAACVMAIENGIDKKKIERFYDVLKTGFAESNSERIVIKLRDYLMTTETNTGGYSGRKDILLKTQRSIKAFISGEIISRLVTPDKIIYEV